MAGRNLFEDSPVERQEAGVNLFSQAPVAQQPTAQGPIPEAPAAEVDKGELGFFERGIFARPEGETQDELLARAQEQAQAQVRQGVEPLPTIATAALAEPIAGLIGLISTPRGGEQATKNIETVREALTILPKTPEGQQALQTFGEAFKPIADFIESLETGAGEAGFEAAGPLGGAIGTAVPTAIGEVAGLGVAKLLTKAQRKTGAQEPEAAPEAKDYEQIISDLENKRVDQAAEQVLPDAEILAAADELGVDLNPSNYSTNRAFIDVENSLKSRPGSKLAAVEEKAIKDLGERADQLVRDLGGETDKSLLDINIGTDIGNTINNLARQSDIAYRAVDEAIPRATIVNPAATIEYLNRTLNDLGGDTLLLSSAEKKLLSLTREGATPTYTALDRVRKDVGDGLSKHTGPFRNDSEGNLKQVFAVLSEDQQGVSDAFGVGADYAAARRLVASRKEIEGNALSLFGREMQGSIIPKLTQAATSLTKGDITKFSRLMRLLPESRRAEAAATMLNDLFTLGARNKGAIGQGFSNAFKGLNRNAEAKNILFGNLPDGARRRFDLIGKVATGIFRSKALENTSKTARDLVAAMEDGGLFSKVYAVSRQAAMITSGPGAVLGTALNARRTKATESADEFLRSKAFRDAIEVSAQTGNARAADEILAKSTMFNKWLGNLNQRDAAQVTSVGFIPWVTGQAGPQQEENQQ